MVGSRLGTWQVVAGGVVSQKSQGLLGRIATGDFVTGALQKASGQSLDTLLVLY